MTATEMTARLTAAGYRVEITRHTRDFCEVTAQKSGAVPTLYAHWEKAPPPILHRYVPPEILRDKTIRVLYDRIRENDPCVA